MLYLKTLGGWRVTRDSDAPVALASQRVALLAVLVASGEHGVARDRVAALLWPESTEDNARHSLGQSLYALRRDAGSADVVVGTTTLRLDPDVVRCDAWELDVAHAAGDALRVTELYEGPFLDGVRLRGSAELAHLIDAERDRLGRVHADAIESLARRGATAGDHHTAAAWWRRLAAVEPLSSRVALELVRALAAAGDRAAALQAARVHEALVRQELETAPDPSLVAFADALRRAPGPAPSSPQAAVAELTPRVPARVEPGSIPPATAPNVDAGRATGRRVQRLAWATLATAATVAIAVGAQRLMAPAATLDPKRVYVASFENRTGDPALDQIGGMASDWVSQGLEQSGIVAVASAARAEDQRVPNATSERRDATHDARQAARLGAGSLVSGAFYKVGEQLRFHVQLTDVARGEVLDAFDATGGTATDPTAPLETVRQRSIGSLASFIDPRLSSWVRVASKPPSYDAYREFVAGQTIWGSDHRQALVHFLRASELDTTFYAARVESAILHRLLGECERTEAIARELSPVRARLAPYEYHVLDEQVAQCDGDWERSYREARAVVELRPRSAFLEYSLALQAMQLGRFGEARTLLNHHALEQGVAEVGPNYAIVYAVLASAEGDRARGIEVTRWVRARYPTYARAWALEATLLARAGRVRETEQLVDTMAASPLAPSSAVVYGLRRSAAALAVAGDTAAARRTLARALAVLDPPDGTRASRNASERAQLLYEMGRFDEAKVLLTQLVATDSSDVDARGHLGLIAARRRDTTTTAAIDAWLATARPPYIFTRTLYRARMASALGLHTRALELLGSALDEAGRFLVPAVREYPEFACLRDDDRFDQRTALR
jgi:DNA-binding SARP family transcriptional activator/tetratricopeptide (TPR) repeat protein/TolB-like protein